MVFNKMKDGGGLMEICTLLGVNAANLINAPASCAGCVHAPVGLCLHTCCFPLVNVLLFFFD